MTSTLESDATPSKGLCATEAEFENYDVFISHRGPNTKQGFVGHLYEALKGAGLHPFLDCKSIGKAQHSRKCIAHAIETTPLALVIFSKNFAQSDWCLKELHAMLNCPSVMVLPIFYNVQPTEVHSPKKLAAGFMKLRKRYNKTLIEEWRADLVRASMFNGWKYRVGDQRLEADLVKEVVGKIFELANKPLPLDVGDHIVGVKKIVENLIQIVDEKKVLMLGLWGMGGIGKSTLAKELYNQLGRRFDARCYLEGVAQMVNQGDLTRVQNHILKALCENESMQNILGKSRGKVILEERLSKKQILVVLDDVRDDDELDSLMSRKMLKEGSMCIITSRNRRVFEKLTSFHVNHEVHTHKVELLSEEDSRRVFTYHAFGGDREVPSRFGALVGDVSMACGGVPLVLKVCGSLLKDEKDVEIWKEVLKKLNCGTIMNEKKIFECLWISYDTLEEQYQEMFLDIACALLGAPVEMAKLVWRSQGWSIALGVRTLVEKALITVDEFGDFGMHDHLRSMGRAIAKQKRTSLDFCKRLWGSESLALLNKNEPLLDSLQTLILRRRHGTQVDLSIMKGLCIMKFGDELFLTSSFPKKAMCRLLGIKTIHASLGHFPEAPENRELVILFWNNCLMERSPKCFGSLRKLEVLDLGFCAQLVELPDLLGGLQNLKILNLSLYGIQSLPDSFGGIQNLKNLDLSLGGCQSLLESFGMLSNLEVMNLPTSDGLPDSLGPFHNFEMSNLEVMNLPTFDGLPDSLGPFHDFEMSNLEVMNLPTSDGLPDSLGPFHDFEMSNLEVMNLPTSDGLPDSLGPFHDFEMSNLEVMNLPTSDGLPDSLGPFHDFEILHLRGHGIQSSLESFVMLSKMEVLNVRWCRVPAEL